MVPNHRPPLGISLRYLVTTWCENVKEAHRLLGDLMLAALEETKFEVEAIPAPVELWRAFGIAPRAEESVDEIRWFDNWTQFVRVFAPEGSSSTPLANAVFGFFLNGGSLCCVVNVGKEGSLKGAKRSGRKDDITEGRRRGLDLLDETDPASHDQLLTHCENRKNRVAILDDLSVIARQTHASVEYLR
jgi:hypothetical protein